MPKKFDLNKLEAEPNHGKLLKTAEKKKKTGRPPKEINQKMGGKVTLSFTPSEMQIITEKSGLIPLATYLRGELKKAKTF